MKNVFDGLISRLDTAEEANSELEDHAHTHFSSWNSKRKNKTKTWETWEKEDRTPTNYGTFGNVKHME